MWNGKQIFVDPVLDAEVRQRGFAVRRVLSAEEAEELRRDALACAFRFDGELQSTETGGVASHVTSFHENMEYRRAMHALGQQRLGDKMVSKLHDYRLVLSGLFAKLPGSAAIQMHSDWTMQESAEWPTVTAWIALVDTSTRNGTLRFLPGSHGLFPGVTHESMGSLFSAALNTITDMAVPVELRAGEAVFFDQSVMHGSGPNMSDSARTAFVMAFIPTASRSVYHFVDPAKPDVISRTLWDCEERLLYNGWEMIARCRELPVCGESPRRDYGLSREEVLAVLNAGDAIRSGAIDFDEVVSKVRAGEVSGETLPCPFRNIFRDPAIQADYHRTGVVQRQLLTSDEADALVSEIKRLESEMQFGLTDAQPESGEYLVTNFDRHETFRHKVHDVAFAHLKEKAESLLPDYRALSAWLFIKPAGASEVPVHRDWSMQEDCSWPTINVWFALDDVDESNGIMEFVEPSLRLFDFPVSPMRPMALQPGDTRMDEYKTARPAKKGEALIFDAGMYHGSRASTSSQARYAITITCIPKHRQPVMFNIRPEDPTVMEMVKMDTQDHLANSGEALLTGRMSGEVLARLPIADLDHITMDRIIEAIESGVPIGAAPEARELAAAAPPTLYRRARSIAGRMYRRARREAGRVKRRLLPPAPPVAMPAAPPYSGSDFAPYPAAPAPWQPFGDAQINATLRDQGYVTMPFLSPQEVDALSDVIDAAEQRLDRDDVHIPTHFMLSAFNNDGAYKERLFDSVWAYLEAKVGAVLPGYEPLVINVFDKPPSDAYDPVPIHQNPSFVDEPAHKSVSLWIPMCDVDRSNGTVGVLPGSHNRFNTMRAGNMEHEAIFADIQDRLENELFVPVELAKGEMLALDDSILHWSYPNVSPTRRKAVQLIMVPKGVPHIYYYYDDANPAAPMMDRYNVDRHFFFGFNCKARPETLEHIDRVPYHYRRISEADLHAAGTG